MGGPAAGQAAFRHPPPATATTCPDTPARKGSTTRAGARTTATTAPGATAPLIRFGSGGPEAAEKITKGQQNGPLLRRTCLTVAVPPRKAPTPSGEVRQGSIR